MTTLTLWVKCLIVDQGTNCKIAVIEDWIMVTEQCYELAFRGPNLDVVTALTLCAEIQHFCTCMFRQKFREVILKHP